MEAEYDFSRMLRQEVASYLVEKGIAIDRADDIAIAILNRVNRGIDNVLRHAENMINSDDDYIRW